MLNGMSEREKLELDVQSRLLFTYRKGFKPIGQSWHIGHSDFVIFVMASELSQREFYVPFLAWGW